MSEPSDNTPVLVGVGQVARQWDGRDSNPPTPLSLGKLAADAAIADSDAVRSVLPEIDKVVFVRLMQDSVRRPAPPFGSYEDLPASLAAACGLSPKATVYSSVGGQQPQTLVNEACTDLFEGRCNMVLLAGAEATGAMKTALRTNQQMSLSDPRDKTSEDRGFGPDRIASDYEIRNGIGMPPQSYGLLEQAYRNRLGLSQQAYWERVGTMFERFADVASTHPHARFGEPRSKDFLANESHDNRRISNSYLKWHIAQDAVNQGAALLLTTVARARELGISKDKWVFLHSHAEVTDYTLSQRQDLSRSRAIELTLSAALDRANLSPDDIAHFDLYSCFPSVVFLAAEQLGLDPLTADLTVTGGLPFFGGPGNNYSMHAIATMVEILRRDPMAFGLILANGGFASKEAVGIYSATPVAAFAPTPPDLLEAELRADPPLESVPGPASIIVESHCVMQGRDGPSFAYVIGRTETDHRVMAKVRKDQLAAIVPLLEDNPIGRVFDVSCEDGTNYVHASLPTGHQTSSA